MTAFSPNDPAALITYDFALRPNLIVRFNLPVGLTTDDLGRLVGFLTTLAFEPGDIPSAMPRTTEPPVPVEAEPGETTGTEQ